MARTFGQELLHFAQSVDIIDVETCDSVRQLLDDYFSKALRIDFWERQTDGVLIECGRGLRTCMTNNSPWTNRQANSTTTKTQPAGSPNQTTFAYETRNIPRA